MMGSDKIIYWLGRFFFLLGFIMSKNVRGCVLNFCLAYKITTFCGFWHNKTQKDRVSTESINYLIWTRLLNSTIHCKANSRKTRRPATFLFRILLTSLDGRGSCMVILFFKNVTRKTDERRIIQEFDSQCQQISGRKSNWFQLL